MNTDLSKAAPTQHHFANMEHQVATVTLGMWLFLATEILFFGALFVGFFLNYHQYALAFQAASHHSHVLLGTINTAVLLCSSLTMVLAVHTAKKGDARGLFRWLIVTILLGSLFLGIKSVEYYHHIHDHLFPNASFRFDRVTGESEWSSVQGARLFFTFYFIMTALHALHMVIGIGILSVMSGLTKFRVYSAEYYSPIEMIGLYWHFVDVIWIFLFPMFYLIGGLHGF